MAGIYVHIPFCKSRCGYCAFYSTTLPGEVRGRYVAALCREISARAGFFGRGEVGSVYLGGGTPSQLSPAELESLLDAIARNFRLAADAEITIEVNPDDVSREYARALASLPINRVSMGVQSLCDGLLRMAGRRHSAAGALRAYDELRNAGIRNVSLDLIYGFPGETMEQWESDVEKIVTLRPEHISAYALSYEDGTPMHKMLIRGEIKELSDEAYSNMYERLMDMLQEAGYEHYEISNFALPGRLAVHNSSYWTGEKYLGVGAGAHGFDGLMRRHNLPDVMGYINSATPPCETETLSAADMYDEAVMTRLRTREGLCLGYVALRFGASAREYALRTARPYVDGGRLEMVRDADGREWLRLTRSGIFISDRIISDMMNPD